MAESSTGADPRAAVAAGFLGWTLDAFDFFLVVFCLTAIGHEFGKSDPEVALSITITLAFRPVGAFLFGLLADRYGRRLPLMIDLIFYSVVEVLTGLAPNFSTFLLLRALFGIGMGGEWGVGASLAMEKVPVRLRGVLSGLLQQGYALGYLLAAVAYFLFFERWGWRPLFFLGGLPALLALYVRLHVTESEVWQQSKRESWGTLGQSIAAHWKLFLYLTILMTAMNLSSHGTQDMFPTFLQRYWGFGPERRSVLTAVSMIGAIAGGITVGLLSDRFGRRKSVAASLTVAVLAVPLWAYAPTEALLLGGAFLMQFFVQGAWGVIPAHLSELCPNAIRGFLPGFAYQCGVLLASAVVYLEAVLAGHVSFPAAMALTAVTVFVFAIATVLAGPEKRGTDFREKTYLDEPVKEKG
jgi:MFS transporter, SHS family, lactate transporter